MDDLEMLIMARIAKGESVPLNEYTATGNPATFETNVAKALTGFTVPFLSAQAGDGNPSPENIRPISGLDGITICHSGADTSDPATVTVAFPDEAGTVYGGTLDLLTGVLTVTHGIYDFTGEEEFSSYSTDGQNNRYSTLWGSIGIDGSKITYQKTLCSQFTPKSSYSGEPYGIVRVLSDVIQFMDPYATVHGNVTGFKNWLKGQKQNGTPVRFCYPLAESQTYQLTPQQITTLIGVNTIWTDTNGTNTVKYLKQG